MNKIKCKGASPMPPEEAAKIIDFMCLYRWSPQGDARLREGLGRPAHLHYYHEATAWWAAPVAATCLTPEQVYKIRGVRLIYTHGWLNKWGDAEPWVERMATTEAERHRLTCRLTEGVGFRVREPEWNDSWPVWLFPTDTASVWMCVSAGVPYERVVRFLGGVRHCVTGWGDHERPESA